MSRDTQLPKIRSLVGLLSGIRTFRNHDETPRSPSVLGSAPGELYETEGLPPVDTKGSRPSANASTAVEHSDKLTQFASLITVEK